MQKHPSAHLITVAEFMTRPVFALAPEQPVLAALEALIGRGISGAPVVDADNRLLGVLSEYDCLRVMAGAVFHSIPEGQVSQYMSRDVETVTPAVDLFRVAAMLQEGRFRRLPVVDDGRLVGIVARRDVLRALDRARRERAPVAAESVEERSERRSALHE